MSLRDQLVKAGFADRKAAQQAARDLKLERKQAQAARRPRTEVRAEEAEKAARAREERLRGKLEARATHEREREVAEMRRRVGNILAHYRVRARPGPQRFWHLAADRHHVHRLDLQESIALELRAGRMAVAWLGAAERPEYVVLDAATALRVEKLDPDRIVFFNREPPDPADPAEELC